MQQALKWKHPSLAAGGRQKKCASRLWLVCAAEGREKFRGLGTWLGLGLWGELKAHRRFLDGEWTSVKLLAPIAQCR